MKIRPVGAKLFLADRRTDGQTDRHNEFDVFLTVHHSVDLFQVTNLMHTSFIL